MAADISPRTWIGSASTCCRRVKTRKPAHPAPRSLFTLKQGMYFNRPGDDIMLNLADYLIDIVAVDGEAKRLDFAKEMGATKTVNFKDHKGIEALAGAVKDAFGGYYADFAFQCTGSPVAHANIYKFIRSGGGLCELGFFINGGDATINPHFDICSKEITTVGSWVYTLRDYATTFDFLKRAKGIGLPMEKLITHKFPLEQINEALEVNLKMEGLKIAIVNK
jgi:threonine dehydrogenase-like Zn-dependent dehydrogenase